MRYEVKKLVDTSQSVTRKSRFIVKLLTCTPFSITTTTTEEDELFFVDRGC